MKTARLIFILIFSILIKIILIPFYFFEITLTVISDIINIIKNTLQFFIGEIIKNTIDKWEKMK